MPAIPSSTRDSITWRLLDHAGTHWPQLDTVREHYDDAVLRTGLPAGTPQEALDTACTIHLAGLS